MSETALVQKNEVHDFINRLMIKAGCRAADAIELADVLVFGTKYFRIFLDHYFGFFFRELLFKIFS